MRRALLIAVLLAACRRESPPPRVAAVKPAATEPEAWEALPARDAYAGSATCRECHEKNFDRWTNDWHARALREATPRDVVGDFQHAHFRGRSSEAWMEHRGGRFVMRTRNREGRAGNYNVDWVIGGKRMQDGVTVFDDGRWQVLPVYFHVTGRGEWVDYNEAKQGIVTRDHPFFWTNFQRTANKECLECHATGLETRYDRKSHRWSTHFVDAGVACEACHGPGARHAETKDKRDIVQPRHVSKELGLSICGRCHGPREPLFPLLDVKDRFRPGQRYDDKFQALVVVDGTQRSGEYFADGRPSSSTFEYQALLQSRCFRIGGATCLTCHTAPHEEHVANDVKKAADASCAECHRAIGAAHSHHRDIHCVDCHMPKVLSGVLDKFADHTLDVPNVENTIRHGVPNACGVCHARKTNGELARTIAAWWPDAASRQARRVRLADAIDERAAAESLPALVAVVRDLDEAPTLRGAAAILLGQRFHADAPAVLVPLLDDRSEVARAKFIEALGYANARSGAIAKFLHDPSLQVREAAALVLGDEAALRKLADDPATHALFRPHVMLSIAAANRGDMDGALREIDAAIAQAPYVGDALVFRADILARRGDLAGARAELEEALRFEPGHRGALARLAR
ncbi:MAG TPA: ammonia-forming cytochrome c nitrite reductase subunit c552 [Thermoanaerobaculia bacterium]|nr:ammonia-forming cytochrome c nitrite reductase subunit c552 [Thermoanaerobaculia bacterium]